jgi:hypothetical protein
MQDRALEHRFVDVGCMQVNLHYHPDAFASLDDAFDPTSNADYGAQLLVQLYQAEARGRWDIAVGLYHSHTLRLADKFRDRVARIGASVLHGTLTAGACYLRATDRRPLLPISDGGKLTFISMQCASGVPGRRYRGAASWRHPTSITNAEGDVHVSPRRLRNGASKVWTADTVLRPCPTPTGTIARTMSEARPPSHMGSPEITRPSLPTCRPH